MQDELSNIAGYKYRIFNYLPLILLILFFWIYKNYKYKRNKKKNKKNETYISIKYKSKKERSLSRDLEKSDPLKYPPINQDQFRAVLIDYLMSDQFDYLILVNEGNVVKLALKKKLAGCRRQSIMMKKRLEEN